MHGRRIDSILTLKPLEEAENPCHPQDSSVEFDDVCFSYDGEKNVLKNISLVIPAGQTVAFVGPSAAAKLRWASMISRFYDLKAVR